jgi:hypothetical protein
MEAERLEQLELRRLFLSCAQQGALTWECKSPTNPTGGIVNRTARVFIARWNLKEAAGKALSDLE